MWIDVIHIVAGRRGKAYKPFRTSHRLDICVGEGNNTAGNAERRPLEEHQATQEARDIHPRLLHQCLAER